MAWSTRELAELAGTTLKAIRYYHRIGLLDEPDRAANGYKRYRVTHLIRLLRIRRLVDLGVPLSDIPALEESDENAEQALRALDAELKASIERQQRMREELASVLRNRTLVELPSGFDGNTADMSDADRAMLMVYSRVMDETAMSAVRALHAEPQSPVWAEFDALPADADEDTRQRLAELCAPLARRQVEQYPFLKDAAAENVPPAKSAVIQGLLEFYNLAQLDVLRRMNIILEATPPETP